MGIVAVAAQVQPGAEVHAAQDDARHVDAVEAGGEQEHPQRPLIALPEQLDQAEYPQPRGHGGRQDGAGQARTQRGEKVSAPIDLFHIHVAAGQAPRADRREEGLQHRVGQEACGVHHGVCRERPDEDLRAGVGRIELPLVDPAVEAVGPLVDGQDRGEQAAEGPPPRSCRAGRQGHGQEQARQHRVKLPHLVGERRQQGQDPAPPQPGALPDGGAEGAAEQQGQRTEQEDQEQQVAVQVRPDDQLLDRLVEREKETDGVGKKARGPRRRQDVTGRPPLKGEDGLQQNQQQASHAPVQEDAGGLVAGEMGPEKRLFGRQHREQERPEQLGVAGRDAPRPVVGVAVGEDVQERVLVHGVEEEVPVVGPRRVGQGGGVNHPEEGEQHRCEAQVRQETAAGDAATPTRCPPPKLFRHAFSPDGRPPLSATAGRRARTGSSTKRPSARCAACARRRSAAAHRRGFPSPAAVAAPPAPTAAAPS